MILAAVGVNHFALAAVGLFLHVLDAVGLPRLSLVAVAAHDEVELIVAAMTKYVRST